MEDIISAVAEKAGISETQAKMAVAAIFDRFDDKLPGPIANQVKKALGIDAAGMLDGVAGDLTGGEGVSGLADKAKGMLGGAGAAGGLADLAKGALGDAGGAAEGGLGGLGDMAKGLFGK